jgi:hypothetical protein
MPVADRFGKLALGVLAAACLAGCSKEVQIVRFPVYWTDGMEKMRIAVVPFRNQTAVRGAGQAVSDELANTLSAAGTYRGVFNHRDLKALLDQRDVQLALGDADAALARQLRGVPGLDVQAILVGTVTTYDATQDRQQRVQPQKVYDRKGRLVAVRQRRYVHIRNQATVAATAALIRVGDGTTIHATPAPPPSANRAVEGSPPKLSPMACLAAARGDVVTRLASAFCITRAKIKMKPGEDFLTTRQAEPFDGKWEGVEAFPASADEAYVVLRLPDVAERNRFRIGLARRAGQRNLLTTDVVWRRGWGHRAFRFSPAKLAAEGGGPGEYLAKLYAAADEPALTCAFRITP